MILRLKEMFYAPISPFSILIGGFYMFLWGFWIGNPFWTVFDKAQAFGYMQTLAPEWVWGSATMLAGAVILVCVFYGRNRLLKVATMCGFLIWSCITLLLVIGNPAAPGVVIAASAATHSAYQYLSIHVSNTKKKGKNLPYNSKADTI